jgi:hypothetical protein
MRRLLHAIDRAISLSRGEEPRPGQHPDPGLFPWPAPGDQRRCFPEPSDQPGCYPSPAPADPGCYPSPRRTRSRPASR